MLLSFLLLLPSPAVSCCGTPADDWLLSHHSLVMLLENLSFPGRTNLCFFARCGGFARSISYPLPLAVLRTGVRWDPWSAACDDITSFMINPIQTLAMRCNSTWYIAMFM